MDIEFYRRFYNIPQTVADEDIIKYIRICNEIDLKNENQELTDNELNRLNHKLIELEDGKKAIEILNNYINAIDTFGTIDPKCCNNLYNPAKVILKLIQKQQKEIIYWKNGFERELEDNRSNTSELLKQDKELRKKDKIIDEMANYIEFLTVNMRIPVGENMLWDINEIKQHFERKVEND